MKSLWIWIIIAGAVGSAALISSAAGQGTGGDQGWYVVHCNVYGANVYFDNNFVGTIQQGTLTFPALTTGSYQTLTVRKNGYTTYTQNLTLAPGKGESVDLYATLNPVAGPTAAAPGSIGGDSGWFVVHSNVDGANVTFGNDSKGTISQGILRVQVYVTGTPYTSYTVYKSGYIPFTGSIDQYPAKGETIDLNGTLSAVTPSATPAAKSPLLPEVTGAAVLLGVMGILWCSGKRR